MTTLAIKARVPSKLEMAKAISQLRADSFNLDELIEIAREIEFDSAMKMPLTIVRRDYEHLCKGDAE